MRTTSLATLVLAALCAVVAVVPAPAGAQKLSPQIEPPPPAPKRESAEDAFRRSLSENLEQSVEPRHLVAMAAAAVGFVLAAVAFNRWRQATGRTSPLSGPRAINHPGKLLREVSKGVSLRSAEVKQLKALAREQEVASPLVLMLCPSLLAKAVKESPRKLDRGTLNSLIRKLVRR